MSPGPVQRPTRVIPLRGFGTFQADNAAYPPGTAKAATLEALKVGYRHIDTAYAYGNGQVELEVGEAIRERRIPRDEIFVVTKLHNTFHDPADVETGLDFKSKTRSTHHPLNAPPKIRDTPNTDPS
ncbi:hypothetical protein DL771_003661 [Monosporascus sp. 5C6A]|nr:hypothetical protein DL771_003661 [Monosporascus sp. 5C6A]